MDPNDITLNSIDKLFEYEKHARLIDGMDHDQIKLFAKLYCKLYLKQQEVVNNLKSM